MSRKLSFLAGLAAGYVMGAAAGRERYEQIKQSARKVTGHPKVQQTAADLQQNAVHMLGTAKEKMSSKLAERDLPLWKPGRKERPASEGPGPVAAEAPEARKEDAWAAATQAEGPVH